VARVLPTGERNEGSSSDRGERTLPSVPIGWEAGWDCGEEKYVLFLFHCPFRLCGICTEVTPERPACGCYTGHAPARHASETG
jgi:hypothetical protein